MPSTGKLNGTLLLLYVGGVAVGATTSHTYSLTQATRDATTKDSGGWEESLPGLRNAEVSFEGFVSFDETYGYEELHALIENRTLSTIKFSSEVTGDPRFQYSAHLISLEKTAPVEDTVTFSGTFKTTGAVTVQTVT